MQSSAGNLRDVQFESTIAQVLSGNDFPRVLVRWRLRPTTQNLRQLKFVVYRGESPEEMVPISAEIAHDDLYEYLDTAPLLKIYQKNFYYRIVAREYRSNAVVQTFESELFTWDIGEDLVGTYIIEEHEFKYRYVAGAPAMVFKRKRNEVHCPDCFDHVLKRVKVSNCKTCYGTGKLGGFYKPSPLWMDFNPENEILAIAEFGEKQVGQTDGELTNYPLLDPGDLVLQVLPNKLYRVESIFRAEKRQVVLRQLVRLNEVNRSDIEYRIPVDEEMQRKLVDEFEEIRKEVEF